MWRLPDGETLAARTCNRLRAGLPLGALVAVNANRHADEWSLALPGVTQWPDPLGSGGGGPLAGVAEGLRRAMALGARWLLTVPVDAAGLPADYAGRMLAGCEKRPERATVAAVPRAEPAPEKARDPADMAHGDLLIQHPCALWPVTPSWLAYVGAFLAAGRGPRAALQPYPVPVDKAVDFPTRTVLFPPTPDLAFSLNTPTELAEWWPRATGGG